VKYRVLEGPRHGRLRMTGGGGNVRTFSQDDIDNERVFYEHRDQGQFADSFHLDVSCGSERRGDLEFGLDVLPAKIPLEVTGNLTVAYAGSVTLTTALFTVTRQQVEVRETCSLPVRGRFGEFRQIVHEYKLQYSAVASCL